MSNRFFSNVQIIHSNQYGFQKNFYIPKVVIFQFAFGAKNIYAQFKNRVKIYVDYKSKSQITKE